MLRNNYINDYIFIEMEINVIIFTDFHSVSLKKWHNSLGGDYYARQKN
jgi:hypothetical protein